MINIMIVANPGGPKSAVGTPYSVSDAIGEETDRLIEIAREEGKSGKRKQTALKALVRDNDA
jgi:hypothetical protein